MERQQVATDPNAFNALTTGNALRRAARAAELSQDVIAKDVGISGSHLNRVLRGYRKLTPELAERIRATIERLDTDRTPVTL